MLMRYGGQEISKRPHPLSVPTLYKNTIQALDFHNYVTGTHFSRISVPTVSIRKKTGTVIQLTGKRIIIAAGVYPFYCFNSS